MAASQPQTAVQQAQQAQSQQNAALQAAQAQVNAQVQAQVAQQQAAQQQQPQVSLNPLEMPQHLTNFYFRSSPYSSFKISFPSSNFNSYKLKPT